MANENQKPLILIVDDEVDLCDTMSLTFNIRGFEVITAYSGNEAIEILKKKPVDILLSDVRMANGNGLELVRWVRQSNMQIPVIAFMSGFSDVTSQEITKLGVTLFFDKPFPVSNVIKAIRDELEVLEKRSLDSSK